VPSTSHIYNVLILQGINISHLGKRKIIFKMPFWGDMLVPWRVFIKIHSNISSISDHPKKLKKVSKKPTPTV